MVTNTIEFRRDRAKHYYELVLQGVTTAKIAAEAKKSRMHVFNELKWYTSNFLTEESVDILNMNTITQRAIFKKYTKQKQREQRLERNKGIVEYLIAGHTIAEAAKHYKLQPPAICKIIKEYKLAFPDLAERYKKAARSHQFGIYRRKQK